MIPDDTESFLQNVALLVVDMQPAFLKSISDSEVLLRRTTFATEAASLFGLRTFFTEQSPDKLGHTHQSLLQASDVEGSETQIIFPKNAFSALASEPLVDQIRNHEIHHLLLCGIEIPICVYQTALSAMDMDLQITLLTDCIGGRRPEDFSPVLRTLDSCGCYLLPSETVFYSLLKTASHPAFRKMTALVKRYSREDPNE